MKVKQTHRLDLRRFIRGFGAPPLALTLTLSQGERGQEGEKVDRFLFLFSSTLSLSEGVRSPSDWERAGVRACVRTFLAIVSLTLLAFNVTSAQTPDSTYDDTDSLWKQ